MTRKLRSLFSVAVALCASGVAASAARAAEITEVVDAFEDDNPIDVTGQLGIRFKSRSADITREYVHAGSASDVRELDYKASDFLFDFRFDIGIFHDLGAFIVLPLYNSLGQTWTYPTNVGAANESVTDENSSLRNQEALPVPGAPRSDPSETVPLIPSPPIDVSRGGFGDMQLGLRWGILSNKDRKWTPAMVLTFTYTAPTGGTRLPSEPDGGIGHGVHVMSWELAMSRRIHPLIDPYISLKYNLPVKNTEGNPAVPQQSGDVRAGAEFTVYNNEKDKFRFTLDPAFIAHYVGEADAENSEISDAIQRVTRTDQYLSMGAGLTMRAWFEQYFFADFGFEMTHDGPHLITSTYYGTDLVNDRNLDSSGEASKDGRISPNSNEFNPLFYRYLDEPGRRLRVEGNLAWAIAFHLGAYY